MFFVPLSTILLHALPRLQSAPSQNLDDDVAWEEWGPNGARCVFVGRAVSRAWTCHTSGMKCVVPHISRLRGAAPSLRVYDFTSSLNRQEPGDNDVSCVVPDLNPRTRIFQVDVETHLPFRCFEKSLAMFNEKGKLEGIIMSEDSIILVTVGPR